jgi:hypothetical protein
LYKTIATQEGVAFISVAGAWAMIIVAVLLVVAAVIIAIDGYKAWTEYQRAPIEAPVPAGGGS